MPSWMQLLGTGIGTASLASITTLLTTRSQRKADAWKGYQALNEDLWGTINDLKNEITGLQARIAVLENDIEDWEKKFCRASVRIEEWEEWAEPYPDEGKPPHFEE